MAKRKKVLLIFCGGTTLFPEKVAVRSVRKKEDIAMWLKNVEEVRMMADISSYFVFGGQSADVGAKEWLKIAETIKKNYNQYDGFVITHGLETLPYTAAVLSLMLQNLGKPVILTGSPIPSREEPSAEVLADLFKNFKGLGVKANLINAVQVAISDIAGLLVIFGSRIFSGPQAESLARERIGESETWGQKILGKIDFGLTLFESNIKRASRKVRIKAKIDPKVTVFDFHPGIDLSLLRQVFSQDLHGLIVKTESASYFPENVYQLLRKAVGQKIPVVIHSTSGFPRAEGDFIYVDNMSLITTVVKLMWILGQTKSLPEIRKMMAKDFAGEIINKSKI